MQIPMLKDPAKALSLFAGLQRPLTSVLSDGLSGAPSPSKIIPGGSPFSFCEVSRSTDLFQISSVELSEQPIHIDDVFFVHIHGKFQESFSVNATFELSEGCGPHCEEHGIPPGEKHGTLISASFCNMSLVKQSSDGRGKNYETCPPEKGDALVTSMGYVHPMLFRTPGWHNFTFDAKTANGQRIYCLTTEICLKWEDEDKNKESSLTPWTDCTWPRPRVEHPFNSDL
ncbi:uncharacterized protein GGS22DRAFT_164033 [Annulohypoxylon maeteangense]|uniref:uncharacterized protein n=1 Tax=Annulohypoxylon maeteangense TaxID=1927788 RepID=UPI002007BF92|nr:uncharacterized protein GGS22DRAFT_164033 [Annulohypoxylon maeteangense]KAI0884649.1 hypothetical protein GGS22DRAFT_164033 [Annulohypoxylon maeteangense]